MKKNKGFTLVEVIMVVVILGIIIGIAVPSYIAISNNIKTKNYEQKIDNIKAKALEYASDYNVENITIPVKVLIEEGYLAEENPDGNDNEKIINPLGGYLDCQNVNITREGDSYKVEVIDSISCSTSGLVNTSKILIDVYEYRDNQVGNKLGTNGNVNWTNSDKVILMANVSNVSGALNDSIWVHGTSTTNKSGKIAYSVNEINDPAEYANVIVVDALVFLDTEYTFSINTNNGYVSQKVSVKIDREIPTASASVSSAWTKNNTKDVQLSGSDGSGSGIDKFYVTTDTAKPDKNAFNRGYINDDNQDYTKAELDVGTYYVYAIDKAGNISNSYKIEVSGIDKTGPVCKYAVGKTNWTQTDFTITYGCQNDTGTGCKTLDKTETINYTAKTKTINWTIEDNIGNKTNCSQIVNTYVDKTPPTCVSSGGNGNWTNTSRTITGTCSDSDSGCVSNISKNYTTEINSSKESPGIVYDKVGNYTSCPSDQTIKIDKTSPTVSISVSSTSSGYNNTTAKVSVSSADSSSSIANSGVASICVQTSSDVNKCSWQSGSSVSQNMGTGRSYDGGSTTFYAWSKDNAGNISSAASSSYTVYRNCSVTWTSWGDWGGCSSSCGSGTKSRGGTRIDSYLGGSCGGVSDSTSCSESYGCPPPSSGDSGGGSSGGSGDNCWADLNHPESSHGSAVYDICKTRANGVTGTCAPGCDGIPGRGWADEFCVFYRCR